MRDAVMAAADSRAAQRVIARIPAQGSALALDYGLRRTGVAIGDLALGIAHPLCTLEARSDDQRIERIAVLVAEWTPVLFVLGLPMHADGVEHSMSQRVRKFARRLEQRFRIGVQLIDERLSSVEAQSQLRDAGVYGREQKRMLDQVAAQIILEAFFSSRHTSHHSSQHGAA